MGSGSSRMSPRSTRRRPEGRQRHRGLAALICGGAAAVGSSSSSNGATQIFEDKTSEKPVVPARIDGSILTQVSLKEPAINFAPENKPSSSNSEGIRSNQGDAHRERSNPLRNADPYTLNTSSGIETFHSERTSDLASSSRKSELLETSNSDSTLAPELEVGNCTNFHGSSTMFSSGMPQLEHGESFANAASSVAGPSGEALNIHSSTSNFISSIPNLSATWNFSNGEPLDSTSSGSGNVNSNRSRDRLNGAVLHVDLVSISSNPSGIGEMSNTETQRNARRLFWDSFSRHSSRRTADSLASLLSSEDTDDLEPRQTWLLDFGDHDFGRQLEDDSLYFRHRRHGLSALNWHMRSEIREQLRSGSDNSGQTTSCPSGIHSDGACSCNSLLMPEVSSTRASIARIVLLAEALFEVLDEIHRQPGPLSLSMVSAPAPESVVNSLPTRTHKKVDTSISKDDVEQCYICLAEYEDGDEIRVLPCRHEYHMPCIDKWLKEIHGVCPLCRRGVCEGVSQGSIPSL